MSIANTLSGLKVLVTRPVQQAQALCERIEQAGGEAILFPVIEIVPIESQVWSETVLAEKSILIFVSRNAVANFVAGWTTKLPADLQLVAVGAGTAAEMLAAGLLVSARPLVENSEGLLSLLSSENIEKKQIWIVRGEGGRETLARGLRARGALVEYIEVYQRQLPIITLKQAEQADKATCAIVTSVASLDNMKTLLVIQQHKIQQQPLIVISERIGKHAVQYGFKQVIVASGASDDAVIQALSRIKMEE